MPPPPSRRPRTRRAPAAAASGATSGAGPGAGGASEDAARLVPLPALVDALGGGLLRLAVRGPAPAAVADLTLAEPASGVVGQRGDLVLGVAVADPAAAADLLAAAGEAGVAGVVLRRGLARRKVVRDAARTAGLALVDLAEHASWAHVVWLLRGVLDRAAADPAERPGGEAADDLFGLADAAAALVDAPVTIEDAHSRVLAYSSRQDVTDPARVDTIVGRRVPEPVLASLRSRGVFRRLARSGEPFLVPADPGGTDLPRFVVPVRAGGEWLGSIWAVVERRPPGAVVAELEQTAAVVALHLLRLRARAELTRRVSADRLRAALTGSAAGAEEWLPPGPWRVVVLEAGATARTAEDGPPVTLRPDAPATARPDAPATARPGPPGPRTVARATRAAAAAELALWESVVRRRAWHQPLLVDVDGRVHVVVTEGGDPGQRGSWEWLRAVVEDLAREGEHVGAAAGSAVADPALLVRSRVEAGEVARVARRPVASLEDVWAAVTASRGAEAVRGQVLLGPVGRLRELDDTRGTPHLATLAAWLDHPGEPTRAAAALHVHPNTLRYRLQRLREAVDLDLDDPAVRLAVRLQLAALGHRP